MVLSPLGSGKLLSTLVVEKLSFYVMGPSEILYQIPSLNFALCADLVLKNWYGETMDLPPVALPYSLHGHTTSFMHPLLVPLAAPCCLLLVAHLPAHHPSTTQWCHPVDFSTALPSVL
ncbi:hypothetical protein GOP47_0010967 [Adiantum capillus-veneris]|uniref:Uncharacterized protein n=1 Tax=Adiantum capillus-veneris TaxID=13818 RepID=A0A9D4UW27_ADICA|nr:hypothetical protein GOP47_0010967 [Adiantum capillus-veneris]